MDILIKIASLLVTIGILVTFHELGHYWVARWCGVKVLRFSVGFGRPLWLRRFGADQTEWVLASIPLGGYVKFADERDESVAFADRARAFNNQSAWKRCAIVIAGPVANFLLAILFFWLLFLTGIPGAKPYLAAPTAGSVAERAGFREMERITHVGGREVRTWGEARMALLEVAAARESVELMMEDENGAHYGRQLDFSTLKKEDLDKDFLSKAGISSYRIDPAPVVSGVGKESVAARVGLVAGDRIRAVDTTPIESWSDLVRAIEPRAGQVVTLTILRNGEEIRLSATPDAVKADDKIVGRLGIGPYIDPALVAKLSITVRLGPFEAIGPAVAKVWDMTLFSLKMMGRMLTGDVSWKNLSGPITIADYAGQSAMMGIVPFVNYLALISISLGVLNLLPIPVLDGGQLMYYMAEILKGSPVSERVMQIGQQVGLALLLGLTAFAFYNDIHRLLTG